MMQRVAVFGATGSIGASALDVIARHPATLRASVLAAGSKVGELVGLCRTHRPEHAVIADQSRFAELRDGLRAAGLASVAQAGRGAPDAPAGGVVCDVVVAAIVVLATAIWYPFFKSYEKQSIETEAAEAAEAASVA